MRMISLRLKEILCHVLNLFLSNCMRAASPGSPARYSYGLAQESALAGQYTAGLVLLQDLRKEVHRRLDSGLGPCLLRVTC